MKWNQLICPTRLGQENRSTQNFDHRSQFQRDYDRIIFSATFRRLQNKTQVFPLPGSIFVHNRLTHSLEVASVGRSLGAMLSAELIKRNELDWELASEIGAIIASACLAHDLGNPPFGHSGEYAISDFFQNHYGKKYQSQFTNEQWNDFVQFDGNANAFRLLSHQFIGRRPGGFSLTYSTLASIVKYPYDSTKTTRQKFGFFQDQKQTYIKIADTLGITKTEGQYARHPLVYLVEAADDICYQVMDIEDAYKMKILTYDRVEEFLLPFHKEEDSTSKTLKTLNTIEDKNEKVSYLRSITIGKLTNECFEQFMLHYKEIMDGEKVTPLIQSISSKSLDALDRIHKISKEEIYMQRDVVEIQIAGHKIITTLLDRFIHALEKPNTPHAKNMRSLIPKQYDINNPDTYKRTLAIVDYVSGMTDVYALELYRRMEGISVPAFY
ncbi:deoxyguanosinetriphosphate triphosphohydrolase [Halosquirtibacter xylanolyticus]|uniref:deoxyguanosinetriphosphate triphosphohydrolase n=1 Tax=Halosquirtibacter xylanolyticus TaxID=3374599 RepID=UPI003749DE66|nr:deoxyguanosinetriphosphate triphosphohydrolase [Prolixibacteraceae bacterium]